jgi:hypothetical protein
MKAVQLVVVLVCDWVVNLVVMTEKLLVAKTVAYSDKH